MNQQQQQNQNQNQKQQQKEERYNETIITLRLPKKYYRVGWMVSHLLGFKSFDEYVNNVIMENIEMHADGRGIDVRADFKNELLLDED